MKPGSLLRIQRFSDSEEDDEDQQDAEMEQDGSEEDDNEEVEMDPEGEDEEPEDDEDPEEAEDDEEPAAGPSSSKKLKNGKKDAKKKGKKGIIFISMIPQHMNVAICRAFMEAFGDVGRIFLQPDSKGMTKKANKKKKNVTFTEGWVEFEKKKVAKWVAQNINATPISSKKGSKFCDILWSLKYLPGFKWIHLSERLTYERAVQHQKLQMATTKARKEANFFQNNLDKSDKLKKLKKKEKKIVKESVE